MSLLQLLHKHIVLESSHILFRTILPSALAAPALRLFGARVGAHAHIHTPLHLHNTCYRNLTIGKHFHIGRDSFLDLSHTIEIGDYVGIAMRVMIITHIDPGTCPVKDYYPREVGAVVIRDGVYIGAGATILYGIEIGENAVIGAGTLVKDNVPPYSVVAGVPGRVVKTLDPANRRPHPAANSADLSAARDSAPASAR